jgi:hypothetical protein
VALRPLVPFKIFRGEIGFVLAPVGFGWASLSIWVCYTCQLLLLVRHHTARSCGTFFPILPLGLCHWLNQIPHALHPSSLYPDIFNSRIHPRSDPPGCHASDAEILSLNIPLPAHHSIWHGYALPGRDRHNVQRSPKGYARHSWQPSCHCGQLQRQPRTRLHATAEVHTNNGGTTPDDILKSFEDVWRLGI